MSTATETSALHESAVSELIRAMFNSGGYFSTRRLPEVNLLVQKTDKTVVDALHEIVQLEGGYLKGRVVTGTDMGPRSTRSLVNVMMRVIGFYILKATDFFNQKLKESKDKPDAVFARYTHCRARLLDAFKVLAPWLACCTRWDCDVSSVVRDLAVILQSLNDRLPDIERERHEIPPHAMLHRWLNENAQP